MNTTTGHALSYPLGTRRKLPHGIANALIFPHVLAANSEAQPERTASVGAALGLKDGGRDEVREGAVAFCGGLELNIRLRAPGVPEEDLPQMAAEAHGIRRLLDWNAVDLSRDDILAIYRQAW